MAGSLTRRGTGGSAYRSDARNGDERPERYKVGDPAPGREKRAESIGVTVYSRLSALCDGWR